MALCTVLIDPWHIERETLMHSVTCAEKMVENEFSCYRKNCFCNEGILLSKMHGNVIGKLLSTLLKSKYLVFLF